MWNSREALREQLRFLLKRDTFTQSIQHWLSDDCNIANLPEGKTTAGIRDRANITHESFIETHASLHGFISCDVWKDSFGKAKPLGEEGREKLVTFSQRFYFFFCRFLPQINIDN